ncbi:1232_t:CDS:1, partial [Acaulospora colombiana]
MASTPPQEDYIKSNSHMFFSYPPESSSFIDNNSCDRQIKISGTVVIRLPQAIDVQKVLVEFKGVEIVKLILGKVYCENIIDVSKVIWQSENWLNYESKDELMLPFEIKVPSEIPESFDTSYGGVKYTLKATLITKKEKKPKYFIEVIVPVTKWTESMLEDLRPLTIKSQQNRNRRNLISWKICLPKTSFDLGSRFNVKLELTGQNPELRVHKIIMSLKNFIRYKVDGDNVFDFQKEYRCFKKVLRNKDISILPEGIESIFEVTTEMKVPEDALPTCQTKFMTIINQLIVKVFFEKS